MFAYIFYKRMYLVRSNLILMDRLKSVLLERVVCAYISRGVTLFPYNNERNWKLKWLIPDIGIKSLTIRKHRMSSSESPTGEIDVVTYENVCKETLDSLCEFFEDVIEKYPVFKTADVSFGDGVLTVNLDRFGTYVINRQSPNKQIWLSSPTSGPKRYDFVPSRNGWVYRHSDQTLHSLLQQELTAIIRSPVDLSNCAYYGDI